MLEVAVIRPIRRVLRARPIPRQICGIVFFPVEIVCLEDGFLEGRVGCVLCGRRSGIGGAGYHYCRVCCVSGAQEKERDEECWRAKMHCSLSA